MSYSKNTNRRYGRIEIRPYPKSKNIRKFITFFIAFCVILVTFFCVKTAVHGRLDESNIIDQPQIEWFRGEFTPLEVGLDADLQEYTWLMCKNYNVDFHLVMAIMQRESGYRTDIISRTNDYGLMQINKSNHKRLSEVLGITDFLDPEQNIHAGVYMLSNLFEKYQDTNLVLMAYNMGEAGAGRLWNKGIFTSSYTQTVLKVQEGLMEL